MGITAKSRSDYSTVTLAGRNGERKLRVETDMGMIEVIDSPGTMTLLNVTNMSLGSSALYLDDTALEGLAYFVTELLAKKRTRTES